MPNIKGFTLIEILVAITIVTVIFGVVITSATLIQKNGRDTQRRSDLAKIQSAIEHYYTDYFAYPVSPLGTSITNFDGTKKYLGIVPKDPQSANYGYEVNTGSGGVCDNLAPVTYCTKYCLYTKLENPPSDTTSQPGVGKPCTNNTSYNFFVTLP